MPAFQVSETIVIDRPREQVFDTVVDYNTWTSWSPWLGIDRDADVAVDGDGTSPGSVYRWAGEVVGVGEIEHVRQQRPSKIEDELRFSKPFKSQSSVRFLLDRVGEGTKLTWQMDGSLPWFLFWMRPMMQRLVGMDYQRGLKMVRDLIENGEVLSRIEVMGVESVSPITVCGVRDACPMAEIGTAMERACSEAKSKLAAGGVPETGEMVGVYHHVDMKHGQFDFTSGYSVSDQDAGKLSGLNRCDLPARRALHLRHIGSYHHLGNAWSGAYQYARYKKLKPLNGDCYEVYRNDPQTTPESDWITDLYIPVR